VTAAQKYPGDQISAPARPTVSVIVPVLNDGERIGACIEALLVQTYPSEFTEIIVVDNGSTDDTIAVVGRYPVVLLTECRAKTPYLARNTGILNARGSIIALIDATCTPVPEWVENGVHSLEEQGADLVGGKVQFTFSPLRGAGESFDSISNLEMEKNIRDRGVAKTANLFFHRRVIDRVGLFPVDQRSGADVAWTGRATRAGLRMVYAPDAVVDKPARGFRPLLRKQYRVGQGQPEIWRAAELGLKEAMKRILLDFLPPRPGAIRRSIRERGTPAMEADLISIWAVAWACKVITNLGRIRALLRRGASPLGAEPLGPDEA
jgi:cellulose synthase/poly-beta-1,6-N-acetylglucosamine synthase-like glycosyltransferase